MKGQQTTSPIALAASLQPGVVPNEIEKKVREKTELRAHMLPPTNKVRNLLIFSDQRNKNSPFDKLLQNISLE